MARQNGTKKRTSRKPRRATTKAKAAYKEGLPTAKVVELALHDINLADRTFEFRISPHVGDLVKSLKKEGQQIPIIVRGQRPYQVISGFRRLRAVEKLGWDKVKAIVRDLDDDRAYALSYLENEVRRDYSVLDRANAVVRLKETGKTLEQVGEILGLRKSQVANYETLLKMDPVLLQAVQDGLSLSHAVVVHYAAKGRQGFDCKGWAERARAEGMSVADLKKALGKASRVGGRRYFEAKGNGFRLYPLSYDPARATAEQREKIREVLRKALEMVGAD